MRFRVFCPPPTTRGPVPTEVKGPGGRETARSGGVARSVPSDRRVGTRRGSGYPVTHRLLPAYVLCSVVSLQRP